MLKSWEKEPPPSKAVLFAGIMYRDEGMYHKARAALEEKIGKIERESPVFPFEFTQYYKEEMGTGLLKRFASFAAPIERDTLAGLKDLTCKIERGLSAGGRRCVNIDPGYVTPHNVVLVTTKEFPHRVFIGRGIFAEVTMTFRRSGPEFFAWTYADYKTETARDFFMNLRKDALRLGSSNP